MQPLVSILIPCYNAGKWLAETLTSATTQTWPYVEVILVDDGSKDRSFEVAKSFQAPNVKAIRQENQGASAARNRAFAEAQGEFIQYLDADDLLSPDKIEAQVRLLEANGPDLLAVSTTIHFQDGEDPAEGLVQQGWPRVDTDQPVAWLIDLLGPESGGMVQPGAWLTPRSIAEKIGPWDTTLTLNDDGEYFARAVLASRGIRSAAQGVNYYRQFRSWNSLSAQKSASHLLGGVRALDLIAEHLLPRTDDARAKKALARLYMDCAFMAYPTAPSVTEIAMEKAAALGGANRPSFGTAKGEFLATIFGWKATRLANNLYHKARKRFSKVAH